MKITKTPKELYEDISGIIRFYMALGFPGDEKLTTAAFALEVVSMAAPDKGLEELQEELITAISTGVYTIFGLSEDDIRQGVGEVKEVLSKGYMDGTFGPRLQKAFFEGVEPLSGDIN